MFLRAHKDEGKQLQPIQAPSEQTPLKSLQEWKMSKSATKPLSLSFSGEGVEKQSTCSAKTPFVLSTLMFWTSYWCRGCWCSSSPGRRIVPLTFDATAIEQGGRRILQKRLQKIVPQDSQTEWRPITSKATTVFDSMNHGGGGIHTHHWGRRFLSVGTGTGWGGEKESDLREGLSPPQFFLVSLSEEWSPVRGRHCFSPSNALHDSKVDLKMGLQE